MGAYRDSEWAVCKPMLRSLKSGMLCLADRGFDGYEYWRQAAQTGAQLLWRWPRYRLRHADLSFASHVQLTRRAQPRSGAFPPKAARKARALVRATA